MAFVLSSVSGNLISAASAGYAPTNGGDVSAIASAYQVVSATGTQLYAGTAFLTGVNGAPISADRAGQAANASLANSAWYDGTGRFISALPDSATVSAIASAYAESAASGKQDTLSFSYDDDKISAINGSALAGQGGLITSVDSALDPWYHEAISGLNGSSIYPKWAASAESANYASTADYATNAQSAGAAPTAWASSFITGVSSPSGTIRVLGGTAIETTNSAVLPSTVIDGFSVVGVGAGSTNTTSFTVPESNPTTRVHFGDAYAYGTFTIDTDNSIHRESSLDGSLMDVWFDLPYATSFTATYPWAADVGYTASASAYEEGGGVGELAWASALPSYSYDGSGNISAINGSAIGGQGGVDSATVSAIASAYVESGVSGKLDSSASSDFYSTANPSGFITGVDLSEYATTGYVDSSVSGKLDTTAFNSGDFYTTANESGFITGVDLSPYQTTADMSSYIPTSMSSDFQQVTGMSSYALSSDVSATVDLVGTQSANWGGSALALSAGPGVRLEMSGNTLVASTDETVLWEDSTGKALYQGITLNESRLNFEMIRLYMGAQVGKSVISYDMPMYGQNRTQAFAIQPSMPFMDTAGTGFAINWEIALSATETSISSVQALYWGKSNFGAANTASGSWTQGANNAGVPVVYKVIGINRTAGV